jgi:dTDP-4-amino-4,6-dideoxygalactose transaminase
MTPSLLFANGTTALMTALRAVAAPGSSVIIPATVCPSVPAAVLGSGYQCRLADIERQQLGIDPKSLESLVLGSGAVVAVHAYGNPCRIGEIRQLCRQHGVPLIEDCAQAEGATVDGVPVGDFGDVAVFSYGAGKILELGGGGRTKTADAALYEKLLTKMKSLPASPDSTAADDLGRIFKFFYNNFFPDGLQRYGYFFPRLFEESALRQQGQARVDLAGRIAEAQADLPLKLSRRRAKADLYQRLLNGRKEIVCLSPAAGAAPWRFNLWLEPALRDFVLKSFLQEGIPVSSWYPDIGSFLGDFASRPNAAWLGAGILNLWLDDDTTEDDIERWCGRLTSLLDSRIASRCSA